jgi:hypothetical protein
MASSLSKASNLTKVIGAYRVIDLNYVLKCHPLEPLDRIHLVEEFTYPIVILGQKNLMYKLKKFSLKKTFFIHINRTGIRLRT